MSLEEGSGGGAHEITTQRACDIGGFFLTRGESLLKLKRVTSKP